MPPSVKTLYNKETIGNGSMNTFVIRFNCAFKNGECVYDTKFKFIIALHVPI